MSWWLAKFIAPQRPAVVVLSQPRSGSSWVGEILGSAQKALYLREPLTQTLEDMGVPGYTITEDHLVEPPPLFKTFADAAFQGLPIFHPRIVIKQEQWPLYRRLGRRVVIKEVNLEFCAYLLRHYQPRIILLVRHPAAIYHSWQRLKWIGKSQEDIESFGRSQGRLLRRTLDLLADYPNHRVAIYEDLCAAPVEGFRRLVEFSGLAWTDQIQALILEHAQGGDRADTYGTFRQTSEMAQAWRGQLAADDIQRLRDAYAAYDLRWYSTDDHW